MDYAFPNWKDFAVRQRRSATGCVPTGYETLLKAAGTTGINYSTFQEDFDLGKDNTFENVKNEILGKYPDLNIQIRSFPKGNGTDKALEIERLLGQQTLVLVALPLKALTGGRGWHIVPVIHIDAQQLHLLLWFESENEPTVQALNRKAFVAMHDHLPGGDDIAYLDSR